MITMASPFFLHQAGGFSLFFKNLIFFGSFFWLDIQELCNDHLVNDMIVGYGTRLNGLDVVAKSSQSSFNDEVPLLELVSPGELSSNPLDNRKFS